MLRIEVNFLRKTIFVYVAVRSSWQPECCSLLCREDGRARLKPHTVSPRLAVPEHIMRPPYVDTGENPFFEEIQVHDAQVCVIAAASQQPFQARNSSVHHCNSRCEAVHAFTLSTVTKLSTHRVC